MGAKLRLLNRFDGAEIFRSDATFDADKQFAEISATMNSNKLALSAEYPTNKDFVAALTHSNDEVSNKEALLNVHLNNSRLLHSRMAWRPNMWSELTKGMEKSAMSAGIKYVQKWAMINNDIADEVAGKYAAVTGHLNEEITPLVDSLEREFRMIDRNMMSKRMDTTMYRQTYTRLIQALRQTMADMLAYNAKQRYTELVETSMVEFSDSIYSSLASLEAMTVRIERALQEYHDNTKKLAHSIHNSVTNGTYVNYAMDKIAEVKNIDISPYVTSFSVPEEYNNVISNLKATTKDGLTNLWERPELDGVRGHLNSVYQQGAWAYKYWDAELNVKENINHIMTLLREIVEDELKELSTEYRTVYKNPITYWAPEQGEIQADLALPFALKDLQTAPDVSPIVAKVEKVANDVAVYLPDQTTLDNIKQYVADLFPEAPKNETLEELKEFKPSKKYKNKGGRKMKKMKKLRQ